MKTKRGVYQSAGGILWRNAAKGIELAVIYRRRYDDWTLPKGGCKKKETFQEAAIREVWEETRCRARLGEFAGCVCYEVQNVPKVVLYWEMPLHEEGEFSPNDEIDAVVWLTYPQALERLSHEGERNLVLKCVERMVLN